MKSLPNISLRWRKRRRGGAVVEFAVCLPLLMLIILGSIEATHGIFLKQALSAAAYEGIREAVYSTATTAEARQKAEGVLNARQIRNFAISFNPSDIATVQRGTPIAIEVTAPTSSNSPFIGRVIRDQTIRLRSVMVKE